MDHTLMADSRNDAARLATGIIHMLREHGNVSVQAIGEKPLRQAAKAVIMAKSYLEGDGLGLVMVPSFARVNVEGEERIAIQFAVYMMPLSQLPE